MSEYYGLKIYQNGGKAMFLGRVGIISLLIGVTGNQHDKPVAFPTDNLIIN